MTILRSRYGEPRTTGWWNERAHWTEFEVREYIDGTIRTYERWASRWAGTFAYGDWSLVAVA